jgi:hypothetical protein
MMGSLNPNKSKSHKGWIGEGMKSLRNVIVLSSLAVMAIVAGVTLYYGRTGSGAISADVGSKDCKFYTFTDRKSYSQGQKMSIGVKNDKYSKCVLKIRDDIGPWTVVNSENKQVYKATAVTNAIVNLKPGERKDWQWNFTTNQGIKVPAGTYKVVFTSLDRTVDVTLAGI